MREDVVVARCRAGNAQQLCQALLGDYAHLCVVDHGGGGFDYRYVALRSPCTTVGTVTAGVAHTIGAVKIIKKK